MDNGDLPRGGLLPSELSGSHKLPGWQVEQQDRCDIKRNLFQSLRRGPFLSPRSIAWDSKSMSAGDVGVGSRIDEQRAVRKLPGWNVGCQPGAHCCRKLYKVCRGDMEQCYQARNCLLDSVSPRVLLPCGLFLTPRMPRWHLQCSCIWLWGSLLRPHQSWLLFPGKRDRAHTMPHWVFQPHCFRDLALLLLAVRSGQLRGAARPVLVHTLPS